MFSDYPTFSRVCIFFLWLFLFSDLLSSLLFSLTLPISAFHLSILSEVSLLNFLRIYLNVDTCVCMYIYLSLSVCGCTFLFTCILMHLWLETTNHKLHSIWCDNWICMRHIVSSSHCSQISTSCFAPHTRLRPKESDVPMRQGKILTVHVFGSSWLPEVDDQHWWGGNQKFHESRAKNRQHRKISAAILHYLAKLSCYPFVVVNSQHLWLQKSARWPAKGTKSANCNCAKVLGKKKLDLPVRNLAKSTQLRFLVP